MKKLFGILTISAFALSLVSVGNADAKVFCQVLNNYGDDGFFGAFCNREVKFEVDVDNHATVIIKTTNVANSGNNQQLAGDDLAGEIITGDAEANTDVTLDVNSTVIALATPEEECDCEQAIGSIEGNDSDDGHIIVKAEEEVKEELDVENKVFDVETHDNTADTGNNLQDAGEDLGGYETPSKILTGAPKGTTKLVKYLNGTLIQRGLFLMP